MLTLKKSRCAKHRAPRRSFVQAWREMDADPFLLCGCDAGTDGCECSVGTDG